MNKRFFLFAFVLSAASVLIRDYIPYGVWAVPVLLAVCVALTFIKRDYFFLITALTICIVSVSYLRVAVDYPALNGVSGTGKVIGTRSYLIEISDTVIDNDGESFKCGKAYLLCDGYAFEPGDIIEFSDAECVPADGENKNHRRKDAAADGYSYCITPKEVNFAGHKTGICEVFNTVREKIYYKIAYIIDDRDTCGVLYAMFTGDKKFVSDYVNGLFSLSGTAHLLAVSGLHVSVLLAFAVNILKKLRAKPSAVCAIAGIFLVFYLFLTGFSPSVVRAAIMAFASMIALISGMRYDSLNSLCFAACFIIAVNPYRIYDVSFQLSFSACFGIIAFYKPSRTLAGELLLSPVKLTAATTVSTLPFVLYSIGKVSFLSVLGNFILVPLATLSLNLLFACLAVAFILPFMNFMLYLPYATGYVMLWAAKFFDGTPLFTFRSISGTAVIALIVLLFFFSRFCTAEYKFKRAAAVLTAFAILGYSLYCGIDERNSAKVNVVAERNGKICVHIQQNGNYIIGLADEEDIREYLADNISYIDALAVINKDTAAGTEYPVDTVYSAGNYVLPEKYKCTSLFCGETVKMGDGALTLGSTWAVYEYNGYRIFIGTDPDGEHTGECDVYVLYGGTVFVKDKLYETAVSGCITIDLKNDLQTRGYRDEVR